MNAQEAKQAMKDGSTVVLTSGALAGTRLRARITVTYEASMLGTQPWKPIDGDVIDRTKLATFEVEP